MSTLKGLLLVFAMSIAVSACGEEDVCAHIEDICFDFTQEEGYTCDEDIEGMDKVRACVLDANNCEEYFACVAA